jgi:hypothetical protein
MGESAYYAKSRRNFQNGQCGYHFSTSLSTILAPFGPGRLYSRLAYYSERCDLPGTYSAHKFLVSRVEEALGCAS